MANEIAARDSNHVPALLAYTGSGIKMLRCDTNGRLLVSTAACSNTPEHHNGSVGLTAATITLGGTSVNLNIHNTHASNNLLVSFDAGTTFYTLETGSYWNVELSVASFKMKGSGAGTTYEIVAVVAS